MDDEKFNQDALILLLELTLKQMGKSNGLVKQIVDTAGNGQEAVDMFTSIGYSEHRYNLIFMDCSMPVMDGYDSAREIRKVAD